MPELVNEGSIWLLRLDGDENRLTERWLDEVGAALDLVEAQRDGTLVTFGSGKFFSNGLDVAGFAEDPGGFAAYIERVERLLARVLAFPRPTIAVLNGHAFGAGALLALAHDYRFMRADRGFFCLPEIDLGMPFTVGMQALLEAKLTPRARTASMLSGRRFGGPEALDLQLVDLVAPEEELIVAARELGESLAGKSARTLAAIKRGMYPVPLAQLGAPLPSDLIPGGDDAR